MKAAAHNPKFAKEAGVPVKVAKEYVAADKRKGSQAQQARQALMLDKRMPNGEYYRKPKSDSTYRRPSNDPDDYDELDPLDLADKTSSSEDEPYPMGEEDIAKAINELIDDALQNEDVAAGRSAARLPVLPRRDAGRAARRKPFRHRIERR